MIHALVLPLLLPALPPQEAAVPPRTPVAREGPGHRATLDLGTGEMRALPRRSAGPRTERVAPAGTEPPEPPEAPRAETRHRLVNVFRNVVSSGFSSTGTTGTEWIDWGVKATHRTDVVGRFVISYATSVRGPSEGGPGASLGLSFYSGTTGFCARGTVLPLPGNPGHVKDGELLFPPDEARFALQGLPGATGSQVSPTFFVTVTLPDDRLLLVPDGRLGWGYTFLHDEDDGFVGVNLTDFAANTGWDDAYDLWSSPLPIASCAGVFNFGGCGGPTTFGVPPPCAGFFLSLWEYESLESAAAEAVEHPANRHGLVELTPAVIGSTWTTEVQLDHGQPTSLLVLSTTALGTPLPVPDPGVGVMLVGPPFFRTSLARQKHGLARHEVPIPVSIESIGTVFHGQAFALRGGGGGRGKGHGKGGDPKILEALNALRVTIGAP